MTDDAAVDVPKPIVYGVASALSPMVRRIVADNPGMMTGPGTNTYLVGIDEIAVIDPGPGDDAHLEAIAGCGGDRIRWILLTHTHEDHSPGAAGLKKRTGAEILAFGPGQGRGKVRLDGTLGDRAIEGARLALAFGRESARGIVGCLVLGGAVTEHPDHGPTSTP